MATTCKDPSVEVKCMPHGDYMQGLGRGGGEESHSYNDTGPLRTQTCACTHAGTHAHNHTPSTLSSILPPPPLEDSSDISRVSFDGNDKRATLFNHELTFKCQQGQMEVWRHTDHKLTFKCQQGQMEVWRRCIDDCLLFCVGRCVRVCNPSVCGGGGGWWTHRTKTPAIIRFLNSPPPPPPRF